MDILLPNTVEDFLGQLSLSPYLEENDPGVRNQIKDELIGLCQQFGPRELQVIHHEFTLQALNHTGKQKMRMYELNAGLYNASNISFLVS